jgi:glycosyltransferase involved in cell wall biosynthesis
MARTANGTPPLSPARDAAGTLPVSVVIPAYNRGELLPRALESVAAQRPWQPAEVIVVDDCSTDDTVAVAEAMGARVLRHEENRGAAATRTTGIKAATHEWIALLDSDDLWLPQHLATLWRMRGDHVVVAAATLRCSNGSQTGRYHGPPGRRPVVVSDPATIMYPANFIPSMGVMIRRDAFVASGGYVTEHRYAEDFGLWLRMLEHGTAIVSPRVTSIYVEHAGQKSRHSVYRDRANAVARHYADRSWWNDRILFRRRAGEQWDDLRDAVRQRRWRDARRPAAGLLLHPTGLLAVAEVMRWREGVKRRSGTVARDGGPTVAIMPGGSASRGRAAADSQGRPAIDLSGRSALSATLRLARRPAGVAYTESRLQAALVKAVGVRPVRSAEELARAVRDDIDDTTGDHG